MKTETGFELSGKFNMPSDEPPGLECGQRIKFHIEGFDHPVPVIVTKVIDLGGGQRQISYSTRHVTAIDPPGA